MPSPSLAVVAPIAEAAADHPRGVEILQGDLFDVGLAALLQLVQYESLSGWLEVARRGVITLHKGQATDARCGALRGLYAVRELLFHRGGRFSLRRGATEPAPGGVVENVTFALMDAYRMRDEFARVSDCTFRPAPARPWPGGDAPLDHVVARCDGRRTLAQALQAAGEPWTPVIDPLLQAIADGRLERADAVTHLRDDLPASEDFFELVDRGRDLMRQGEHRSAHAVLLRALAMRPDDRVVQQNLRALAQRLQQS
jgi:hypothetical protein